ncbi:MAG: creatininase family protein [Myxococcales bacterium]|nr:creatininase family protein [Myxococcales bacterium]
MAKKLALLTTEGLKTLLHAGSPVVALIPVGSVEPHGPHLPLATDTIISEAVAERAAERLEAERGFVALVVPSVPYGVTEFARGFAGAVSVPGAALSAYLRAVVEAYLQGGFAHVCLVNNHLEPDHDAAVRAALVGIDPRRATLACPLTRRWGRTLSDEYKSGACHAGRYETSLMLAASQSSVDAGRALSLPAVGTSLSSAIAGGKRTFLEMGLVAAYTGAPAEATEAEGRELLERLAEMVVVEVTEALAGGDSVVP